MSQKTLRNIYIVGLGAIGSMYASKLQEVDPDGVKIIADHKRIEKYRNSIFTVNNQIQTFNYISPGDDVPDADLIIVAVKYNSLSQAIYDLQSFIGSNTIIISLLNGIGSEEIIGDTVGMKHLLHSYAVGMDAVRKDTDLSYSNIGKIVFGDKNNGHESGHVLALKNLLERANIPFVIPVNIKKALWTKFMLNVGINQVSAILKAPYGEFQQATQAKELMIMAFREVVRLSKFDGINLSEDDINESLKIINTLSPEGKTSMLQDIEAGRKTEVEIFAGAVIKMGLQYKVPTPVNDTFYRIIKFMERD